MVSQFIDFEDFEYEIRSCITNYFSLSFPQFAICEREGEDKINIIVGPLASDPDNLYLPVFTARSFAEKQLCRFQKGDNTELYVAEIPDILHAFTFILAAQRNLYETEKGTKEEIDQRFRLLYNPGVFGETPYPAILVSVLLKGIREQIHNCGGKEGDCAK